MIFQALRVIEDTTMMCLTAVFGKEAIFNTNQPHNTLKYSATFGLPTYVDIYALGAYILCHLMDQPPVKINVMEETDHINNKIKCPVDGCAEERIYPNQFTAHFENEHADDGSANELLYLIRPKCKFGCKKSFCNERQADEHYKVCLLNKDRVKIVCKYIDDG